MSLESVGTSGDRLLAGLKIFEHVRGVGSVILLQDERIAVARETTPDDISETALARLESLGWRFDGSQWTFDLFA